MPGDPGGGSGVRERLAHLSDLDRIGTLVAAAYESHLTRMGFPPKQLLRNDTEAIEAGEIWVTGDPIMAAIILIEANNTLLVENLAVDPSAQGHGPWPAADGVRRGNGAQAGAPASRASPQ